jgi:hypothetical protein
MSFVGAFVMGLLSCSSNATTPDAATRPSLATAAARRATNHDVTDRARASLMGVGAQQLLVEPGYENEVNTALKGVWRGHPLVAYVVPTAAVPPSSELTVVAHRNIKGRAVDVVEGEDGTFQMLRFVLGPDTWSVASPGKPTVSVALVGALLA